MDISLFALKSKKSSLLGKPKAGWKNDPKNRSAGQFYTQDDIREILAYAKRRHIMSQFLSETVLLSGSGGIIGLILGVTIPLLVEHFWKMKTIVTWWSLVAAFCISVCVGLIAGLYPAYRAANMNPIEALRHE